MSAGRQRHRRAARDHRQQIVPAAAHAARVPLEQLAQRNAHLLLDHARLLDVARDLEQLGAGVVGLAQHREPCGAPAQDIAGHGDGLDIVDGGRRAVEPGVGGERRLQARLALLALQAFQQRGFLAADIGAGAMMDEKVEVPAVDVVLADQLGRIGLGDRGFEPLALADELAAHVGVAGVCPHRERCQQGALDQQMRIVPHDLAILAGAGLGLVRVDHEIAGPADRSWA